MFTLSTSAESVWPETALVCGRDGYQVDSVTTKNTKQTQDIMCPKESDRKRSPALERQQRLQAGFSSGVPKAVPVLVLKMALAGSPEDPGRVTVGREGARMAHG